MSRTRAKVIINLEDLSANLNDLPVGDDPTGRGHFLPAFSECMDIINKSLEGNPSKMTVFKRMFAKSGEVLAPQHQELPGCYRRSFYGPLYDTTRAPKYKPHLFDGKGHPREPTPPPPALPEYADDQISVEYPDGTIEWMATRHGISRLKQIRDARDTALRLGSMKWRPIPPPPAPKEVLVVDTPYGPWKMPPRSGGEYRERVGAWARATNARRARDGIAQRVDGEYDVEAVEKALIEALERKQLESEESNRLFAENVDPDEDRQAWKEAFGFIPSKKRRITSAHSSPRSLSPISECSSDHSTDLSTLDPQVGTSTMETFFLSPRQEATITKVERNDDNEASELQSFSSTLKRKLWQVNTKEDPLEAPVSLSEEDRPIKPLPRRRHDKTDNVKPENTPEPTDSASRKRTREETEEEEDTVLTPSKRARRIKPVPSPKVVNSPPSADVPESPIPEPAVNKSPNCIDHAQPPAPTSSSAASLTSTPKRALRSSRASASPNKSESTPRSARIKRALRSARDSTSPNKLEPTRRSARIRDNLQKSSPAK